MLRYYNGPAMGLGFGGFFVGLLGAAFWVLLIWGLIALIFGHRRQHWHDWHHDHHSAEDPLAIAKARYAKGDLTKAEFEQIKKDLDS